MKNYIVASFILFSLQGAWAHTPEFWTSFNNDFIQMEMEYKNNEAVQSRYPKWMRRALEGLVGWYPGTVWDMKSRCSLKELGILLESTAVLQQQQQILSEYVKNCDPAYSKNNFINALKILSQRGSFHHHPFFKYSFLNFPANIKTRALWGVKSEAKRDLVIVRPGVYGNVDELIAERYILYLLTELNDYHVVVLENSTSGNHFVNNEDVTIGAPKEAFENLYLAEQIRKHPKLSKLVDKIHIMGISLGGNGALLSSLINQKEGGKYFDKTLLFCPVVDFESSFKEQMQDGLRSYAIDAWSSRRFKDLEAKKDFELSSFWESLFSLRPRWVNSAWSLFEKKYKFHPEWQTYLSKDFYQGDFVKDYQFYTEQTRLPDNLYVVATDVDPIVFPESNYQRLADKAHEKTFFYKFHDGFHCSFAYTYQWKFLDTMFASLIGSPEEDQTKPRRYEMTVTHGHLPEAEPIQGPLEIRSVEVSKIDAKMVELLVYFSTHGKLKNGHVVVPLEDISLDAHYVDYDLDVIRNYVKRLIQTKFEVEAENDQVFIKI